MTLQVMNDQGFYDLVHLPEVKEDAFCPSEATGIHRPHIPNFCSVWGGCCPRGEPRVDLGSILTLTQPQGHATSDTGSEYKTPGTPGMCNSGHTQATPSATGTEDHPPMFKDSHTCFPMVHRQMLSSSTTSRPLSDLVIFSPAWRGRSLLRVRASVSLPLQVWPVWYMVWNSVARAPLMLNNGNRFRIFLFYI